MKSYYTEIAQLLNSIKLITPTSFECSGNSYEITGMEESVNNFSTPNITFDLQRIFYDKLHCRRENTAYFQSFSNDYNVTKEFVRDLSNANYGKGTWDYGWEILELLKDNQLLVFKKNLLKLWVQKEQFKTVSPSQMKGVIGSVRMLKEWRELLPGFYTAHSNALYDEQKNVMRIYWNVSSNGAVKLMKLITRELNESQSSFRFKILKNPNHFSRSDAAVLYINKDSMYSSVKKFAKIYKEIKLFLKSPTSLFAKRLTNGVSLAEETNMNESFGESRSRILAEGINSLYNEKMNIKEKIKELQLYFKKNGIDFFKPFLNPDSSNTYEDFKNAVFEN